MELIAQIPLIGPFLAMAIPFVVVLGIVVAVHEFGHYIVGRWCGIHAEVFSLGFGKTLWSRTDRRGTKWQIALLPLGGFVKFLGDADASSRTDHDAVAAMSEADRARSFPNASVGRRFLTVLAGPVFNLILSVVVFAGLIMVQGIADKPVIGAIAAVPGTPLPFREGDLIRSINGQPITYSSDIRSATDRADPAQPMEIVVQRDGADVALQSPFMMLPVVGDLVPLSPAMKAGLERGDFIVEADGMTLNSFFDLQTVMNNYDSGPVALKVWRGGQVLDLSITPEKSVRTNPDGGFEERVMIGVVAGFAIEPRTESVAPWTALYYGTQRVIMVVGSSLSALQHIATGKIGADNLSGPIGIAQVSGEMATSGLFDFIGLIAFVSTAIGMLNLFPIPVLDGGHLVVFTYEALRGRPPSQRSMEIAMSIGLAMVLLLMLFATYNDIMRL
jgi:regulator of sigma E protease